MKKFNAHRKLKGAILSTIFAHRSTRALTNAARSHTTASSTLGVGGAGSGVTNGMNVGGQVGPGQVSSKSTLVGAITADDETEAGRKQLIVQLTEATIKCVENGDYEAYSWVHFCLFCWRGSQI